MPVACLAWRTGRVDSPIWKASPVLVPCSRGFQTAINAGGRTKEPRVGLSADNFSVNKPGGYFLPEDKSCLAYTV